MSPTATGRHCAACAKTVVDFTLKTDAEILAYLAKASETGLCGRFGVEQLGRPLRQPQTVALASRWRAWLAAAVAVWGVRESIGSEAKAQATTEWRARYWGGPAPALPTGTASAPTTEPTAPAPAIANVHHIAASRQVVRGVVRDAATNQPLPGVVVFVEGLSSNVSTNGEGTFQMALPANFQCSLRAGLGFQLPGYQKQWSELPAEGNLLEVQLAIDPQAAAVVATATCERRLYTLGGAVTTSVQRRRRPWPWHPRHFYYWSKYWLTRPFHSKSRNA